MIPLPLPNKDRPRSHLVRRAIPSAVQSSCAVCRLETLFLASGTEGKQRVDSHFRHAIGNEPASCSQWPLSCTLQVGGTEVHTQQKEKLGHTPTPPSFFFLFFSYFPFLSFARSASLFGCGGRLKCRGANGAFNSVEPKSMRLVVLSFVHT